MENHELFTLPEPPEGFLSGNLLLDPFIWSATPEHIAHAVSHVLMIDFVLKHLSGILYFSFV